MNERFVRMLAMFLTLAVASSLSAGPMERADLLMASNQHEEALVAYEEAARTLTGADGARATYRVGYCHQLRGRYKEAIEWFKRAEAMPELDTDTLGLVHMNRGYCQRILGDHEAALASFDQAIALPGAAPDTVNNAALYKGWLLSKLKRYDEAIASFKLAADVEGAHLHSRAQGYLSVGDTLRLLKRYDEARAAYEHVLTMGDVGQRGVNARNKLLELDAIEAGDTPFYIDPYVTKVSATSAEVRWVSKGPVDGAQVTVASDRHPPRVFDATQTEVAEGDYRTCVAVVESLDPGVKHVYSVRVGDQQREGSFHTPPSAPGAFSFVVIGDTQTNAHVGAKLAPLIAQQSPAFVVHVGDCVESGPVWFEWKSQLFDPGRPYLAVATLWPTRGNHDGGPYFPRLFGLEKAQHYSFDYGNVHVAVLDAFGPGTGRAGRARQAEWLREDLQNSSADWKIVAVHDPMVNSDTYNAWFGEQELLPVVEECGVDFVFAGHHHLYRRYLPIGQPGRKPVLHVTTGGAGGGLGGNFPSPIKAAGALINHFVTVHVDGNSLELVTTDIDGNTIDRFTLIKSGDAYQDEVMASAVDRKLAKRLSPLFYELLAPHTLDEVPARFESAPSPGQNATLVIDLSDRPAGPIDPASLPDDLVFVFEQAPGNPWRVERQEVAPDTGVLRVTMTAPETGVGTRPEVMLSVKTGGRTFVPSRLTLVVK